MSYQVLARKWRPRLFREMVGQEHVLKALINALDHDRLHHAYLFTGTRGVGKTTIARILAKCLNCEIGVSSEPCNQCGSCSEINEGRFVDLIEVDAASRTKVEDTRELLDNVQYAPTRGRYKVYLIDEVHMLSNSSFNALLKTLEEPPPHVKFLLATTDPQKLPVTVLSRCLQFSLKNMSAERIVGHLKFILEKEMIPFEEASLWHLGRSADGSMRDALSLTDQAISFGGGKVTEVDVRTMLGSIDQTLVFDVLTGLIAEDGAAILAGVSKLAEHSPDYGEVIGELIAVFHRIAIAQVVPEAIDNSLGDRKQIYEFAQKIASEDVQLFYQTALLGRRDLPLSPDARSGLEMILLRMLAFKPQGVAELPKKGLPKKSIAASEVPNGNPSENENSSSTAPQQSTSTIAHAADASLAQVVSVTQAHASIDPVKLAAPSPVVVEALSTGATALEHEQSLSLEAAAPVKKFEAVSEALASQGSVLSDTDNVSEDFDSLIDTGVQHRLPVDKQPPFAAGLSPASRSEEVDTQAFDNKQSANALRIEVVDDVINDGGVDQVTRQSAPESAKALVDNVAQLTPDNWFEVYRQLSTGGLLQNTVANCIYVGVESGILQFLLDEQQSTLYDNSHQQRLADLLGDYFGQAININIDRGNVERETPAQIIIRLHQERQTRAVSAIQADPVVRQLQENLGAMIIEGSIEPIDG
ncbi:MAG: DNA polymerase-3 subunit gamma/tau [Pseudohongiellaceae bacterium]|jgi:DNA polymerase-3 subunit gamma/tau